MLASQIKRERARYRRTGSMIDAPTAKWKSSLGSRPRDPKWRFVFYEKSILSQEWLLVYNWTVRVGVGVSVLRSQLRLHLHHLNRISAGTAFQHKTKPHPRVTDLWLPRMVFEMDFSAVGGSRRKPASKRPLRRSRTQPNVPFILLESFWMTFQRGCGGTLHFLGHFAAASTPFY